MQILEAILLWGSIAFCLASFLAFLLGSAFGNEKCGMWGWRAFVATFAAHTLNIALRWIISGHPPVYGTYEHALLSSWFLFAVFTAAGIWVSSVRSIGVAVMPVALLILGYGIMDQGLGVEPLPPPYRSNWLWVHVLFAWLAYSAFALAAVFAALFLVRKFLPYERLKKFVSDDNMDWLIFRIIVIGFISLTIEMGAGALWAYGLWGRYWGWDSMETWTLISWLVYAIIIHLRVTMGWKGSKMAWLCLAAFIVILIAFGGIAMMFGLHQTLV